SSDLDVEAGLADGVLAEFGELGFVAAGAVHEVDGDFVFAGIEAEGVAVALAAAVVLVVIVVEADGADVPDLGFAAADALHDVDERLGVGAGGVIERGEDVVHRSLSGGGVFGGGGFWFGGHGITLITQFWGTTKCCWF